MLVNLELSSCILLAQESASFLVRLAYSMYFQVFLILQWSSSTLHVIYSQTMHILAFSSSSFLWPLRQYLELAYLQAALLRVCQFYKLILLLASNFIIRDFLFLNLCCMCWWSFLKFDQNEHSTKTSALQNQMFSGHHWIVPYHQCPWRFQTYRHMARCWNDKT